MKRSAQITAFCISFVLVTISIIRTSYGISRMGFERYIHGFIYVSAGVLFAYTIYTSLIKRLSRGHIDPKKYSRLFELDASVMTGEMEFYFTIEDPRRIKFSILNKTMEEVQVLKDEEVKSGGHIVRFDSHSLNNGIYFYCLETENQKTMKRLFIQHDKLTV